MTRKAILLLLGTFVTLTFSLVNPAWGQNARGTILGHIQDASGAAVPGAKVALLSEQTGIKAEFITTNTGDYLFLKLIPGVYDVTVAASGFRTAATKGLMLEVDQTLRQDFALEVGTVSQEVTVNATASMLQSDSPTIGEVTVARFIQALPLNGRDFTTLLAINAGVTQPAGGIQTGFIFGLHGVNDTWRMSSVNGARPASIAYIIDGIADNGYFFSNVAAVPSEDAIQEFKLQNGLYSAEYGGGSAQVNAALRSGTNVFHGSAYDFIRNDAFQPRSPLVAATNALNTSCQTLKTTPPCALLKTPFKQNQFGFTLGGPVRLPRYRGENRSFWFVSYEGGRRRVTSAPQFTQVPTPKELSGDFSDWPFPIFDPATTGTLAPAPGNPTGRVQFTNNQISSNRFNPIAQKLVNYFPQSNINCTMPCPDFVGTAKSPIDSDIVTARYDQRLTSRDQLTYSMVISKISSISGSILPTAALQVFTRPRLFGLEWNRSLSPNAINTARVGYNRTNLHFGAESSFGPNLSQQLGLQNTTTNPAFFGIPAVSVQDGYLGAGTGNNGYRQVNNVYQYVDNFQYVHGRHTITLGTDIRRLQLFDVDGFNVNGTLTFTGSYTASDPTSSSIGRASAITGNAFADLLLGYPLRAGAPVPTASDLYDMRGTYWGLFAEDDFRMSPRLTLNLGLRYEIPNPFHSRSNSGAVINLATPGGGLIYADSNFVQKFGPGSANPAIQSTYYQCCVTNQLVPGDKTNFAPRIGFAWRPLSTSKFVLRGGYGIFYDSYMRFYDGQNYSDNILSVVQPNPSYPTALGSEKSSPLALSTLWLPPIVLGPTTFPPAWAHGVQTEWPGNHTPYIQQWSLDTQYQLTPSMMLDVGYVGSHTIHEPMQWHFNQAFPPRVAGDPCNTFRDRTQPGVTAACLADPNFQPSHDRAPFANFSTTSFANANIFSSNYHSLQMRLQKRFAQGLQFMGNYTWSKTLDEGSEIAAFSGEALNLVQDAHNLRGEHGPANFDQMHRFVFSYSYDLPVGKGRKWSLGRANWALGGWNTGGILTFASGLPVTIACCFRGLNQFGTNFSDGLHANVNGDPRTGFVQSVIEWFNPSVFSVPPLGTFGNVARNSLRAPGQHQGDVSFIKETPIKERATIQYRLEIFNVFSTWHTGQVFPNNRVLSSPSPCTPGPRGNCNFGSLVGLNGLGELNLWNPHIIQMALKLTF